MSKDNPPLPLSDEELGAIRDMLEQQARVSWAWSTARIFAKWAATTIAAMYAVYQAAKDLPIWKAMT